MCLIQFPFGARDVYRHRIVHMAHLASQVVLFECIKCAGAGMVPSNLSYK